MNTLLFYGKDETLFHTLFEKFDGDCCQVTPVSSLAEAEEKLQQKDFDCLMVHQSPDSLDFDRMLRLRKGYVGLMIVLILSEEKAEELRDFTEINGLYVLSETLAESYFPILFSLLVTVETNLRRLYTENQELNHKITETRLVDRAKCILIQQLKLTEYQAHKYIEKQAMDLRLPREKVAQVILQTYEQ